MVGGCDVAADEGINEGLGQAVDVLAGDAVLQSREGRPRGQGVVGIERRTRRRELEHGVVAQAVGVVTVGVTTGGLKDALTQQIRQAVIDVGRMPLILDG